jgi:5-dehydro-4-deoxyglucarate dehydratase
MAYFSPDEVANGLGKGLLAFPVTPFDSELEFAPDVYRENLSWMVDNQPAGIFAAGGTGEFFSLSPQEVEDVTEVTAEIADGKMPVLAGVGYGRMIAMDLVRRVEKAGADAVLLLPPYLLKPSQEGLAAHIEAVCNSTTLGVIVYNRDNAILDADTLARLCENCPNLVGLKDGVGDIEAFVRIEAKLGDRLLYVGGLPTAELFAQPYLTMGVTTYSSALFNFMPKFGRSFFQAVRQKDRAAVATGLREFILPYTAIRDRAPGYAVSIVKAGAQIIGRPAGSVRAPLTNLDAKSMEDLSELITRFGDRELTLKDAAE